MKNRKKEVSIFFILFYLVGITGLILPVTFPLFLKLIPFALVLSFLALILFHAGDKDKKTLAVLAGIFILGFTVEAFGVKTGVIFGSYHYGRSLGPKLFETPVLIGLNWLFLVYVTSSVFEKVSIRPVLKIPAASGIMLAYDLVLEQVAPKLDMWRWELHTAPLRNYLAWFGISLFFHIIIKGLRIKTQNPLAMVILVLQFLFFLSLFFIKK